MDGTAVLRRAGPSWFGFRRKDTTYELRATGQGLEILRRGKRSWSLDAEQPMDQNKGIH